jgi:coproporphyrinogen III oxidase
MAELPTAFGKEVEGWLRGLQDRICAGLEAEDGRARFMEDPWERPGGGGGRSRVIQGGRVFEKGGVNFSAVHGHLSPTMADKVGGDGTVFFATGVSLVLHPNNPFCPTVHMNYRYFEQGSVRWFGGGADLTPSYLFEEDAAHFHRTHKAALDPFGADLHPRFKEQCDRYFTLPHRKEMRGIGGIFFDHVGRGEPDMERHWPMVQSCGNAFLKAYLPVVQRRSNLAYTEAHRQHQLLRRGRYVEFNLLHDRGTSFGLQTDGRVESILMSLPPLARWGYQWVPAPGTEEDRMQAALQPRDWLAVP